MSVLAKGTTIGGYIALHSGLDNAYLKGTLTTGGATTINGALTVTGVVSLSSRLNLYGGGFNQALSFYSPAYVTWIEYMSPSGAGNASTGGTASALGSVTSWARRSTIENSAGYGWIWDSCANTASTNPTARMSLSSATGDLTATGFIRGTRLVSSGNNAYSTSDPDAGDLVLGSPTYGTRHDSNLVMYSSTSAVRINCSTNVLSFDSWSIAPQGANAAKIDCQNGKMYAAVYNDYAEYRQSKEDVEAGRVLVDIGDGYIRRATRRLEKVPMISSDCFGFGIGKQEIEGEFSIPIAVAGRVLVHTDKDRTSFKVGDAVCSGKDGTVSKMHWWEKIIYPDRIVGIVSEVPSYEKWGTGNIQVNGRIWVKVR